MLVGKLTMNNDAFKTLRHSLQNPKSEIFLSKDWKTIKRYFWNRNINLKKNDILNYLETNKSSLQLYNTSSRRKIAEFGKTFTGPQKFFSSLHADLLTLSKLRKYKTKAKHILLCVCYLSKFVYLEKCNSTGFDEQKKAWLRIFARSEYLPKNFTLLTVDKGPEFASNNMIAFMRLYGVKINFVNKRPYRKSKGSGIAEAHVRRCRMTLETVISEVEHTVNFDTVLQLVEKKMNNKQLSCLGGISPNDALTHDPKYVSMLWNSNMISRRKYVKREIDKKTRNLPKFTVVRILKFKDKEMFKKESYGSLSELMFVVLDYDLSHFITYYRLGNLLTLQPMFNSTFSIHELKVSKLSYAFACYQAQLNIDYVISSVQDNIIFKTKGYGTTVLGPKRLLDR